MSAPVYIGTSGFTYKAWNADFYPARLPQRLQLEYYASRFPTVEINASFYRLPTDTMIRGWAQRVPGQFKYAIKGSRFITHLKKLAHFGHGLRIFFARLRPLKRRLGIILWQLPPMLHKDVSRLASFLQKLRPYRLRHAVEFRHPSWYEDDSAFEVLRGFNVAHVSLSTLKMPMNLTVTSNLVYIRFHGLQGGYAHDYTRQELEPWAKFCREQSAAGRTVFAYFNNDGNVRAPQNAGLLMQMIGPPAVLPPGKSQAVGDPP
jgi:uncharacterized protein YecE (DUF72 family)